MLRSYFVISIRNFFRRSVYNGINIFGLSVGLSIAAIIFLYARHELTYDHFHNDSQRIVRFSEKINDTWFNAFSTVYSTALYEGKFPEVEKTVRLLSEFPKYISHGEDKFYEPKVFITDTGSKFFDLFQFPILYGNASLAFQEENSVALTESTAKKIFGDKNAIGEIISYDTLQLRVSAILMDLPSNSNFNFTVLVCNNQLMDPQKNNAYHIFGLLSPDADENILKSKLLSLREPSSTEGIQDFKFIPLQELHFDGNMKFEFKPPGNKTYLLIFILIGIIILALSCFNFINLSIALFTQRAKEIAVRKVIGANRSTVFVQFIFESVLFSLICFPVGLVLLEVFLPSFNSFMDVSLSNIFLHDPSWFFVSFAATLGVGLLSGMYPALILPRIDSVVLFKSGMLRGVGNVRARLVLIGLQMLIMVIALSGTLIVEDQLEFMQEKSLGFSKDGIFKLSRAFDLNSTQYETIKSKLLQHHSISSVSHGLVPSDEDYGWQYKLEGSETISTDLIAFPTGPEYTTMMDIEILQADYDQTGEDLPNPIVLINETFAKQIGKDCIGQRVIVNPGSNYEVTRTVNGIFKDFHFFSLHQPVGPMMIILDKGFSFVNKNILIKFDIRDQEAAATFINKTVQETIRNVPLTLQLLDDSVSKMYEKEKKLSFFSRILLIITIVLSLLGLIGLASYAIEIRTKEIGIRKMLGASISNLMLTLSGSFIKITMIAFTVGSILSILMLNNWLKQFAYKTSITGTPFVLTLAGLVLILLLTVGLHALKAVHRNPVKSLRSE